MFSPSQLASMKLGVHPKWQPSIRIPLRAAVPAQAPAAFGRLEACPRIDGFNTAVGDCVPTGCANIAQTFNFRNGIYNRLVPDSSVLSIYSQVTGFQMGDPATDLGTDPNDMFAWWKQNDISGVKLNNVTLLDPRMVGPRKEIVSSTGFIAAVLALRRRATEPTRMGGGGNAGIVGLPFCVRRSIRRPVRLHIVGRRYLDGRVIFPKRIRHPAL